MSILSRRQFVQGAGITAAAALAGCSPLLSSERTPARVPLVGWLGRADRYAAFREGLSDFGYVEGQNIIVDRPTAEAGEERLTERASELVQRRVDVILAANNLAAEAAKQVTDTVAIVFGASNAPVESGLVASLARPGGNATGLSLINSQLNGKRLQLLKDTVGDVARVAVLVYPIWPNAERDWNEMQIAAQALGLQLQRLAPERLSEFAGAFEMAARDGADALYVMSNAFFIRERMSIVELAAKYRLPAMYDQRLYAEAGGLVSYGADAARLFRRAAYYVDRILKGAKPADLPVEQPMTFEFVLNMKTAKALGLTISYHILLQATEVIE